MKFPYKEMARNSVDMLTDRLRETLIMLTGSQNLKANKQTTKTKHHTITITFVTCVCLKIFI